MQKVKLVVSGPPKSGKTVLCNFLADATESSSGEYHPTQGVRIVEFESGYLNVGRKTDKLDVELWDCSGDPKFENCWPAMAKDVHGVIFVAHPEKLNSSHELDYYYAYFAKQQGLRDSQCLIYSHNKAGSARRSGLKTSPLMSNVQVVTANLEDDGESLRTAFSVYLKQVLQILAEKQNQDEETIAGI